MSMEREYLSGNPGQFPFGKTIPTPEQVLLLEDLQKLEATMIHRKRHMGYTPQENQDYFEREMFKLEEAYYLRCQSVAEEIQERIEKEKEKYLADREKYVNKDQLDFERWRTKYGAMSKDELRNEASSFIQDQSGWSEDRLDILNAALAKAGIKKIGYGEPVHEQPFSAWIDEKHGREPWRQIVPEIC